MSSAARGDGPSQPCSPRASYMNPPAAPGRWGSGRRAFRICCTGCFGLTFYLAISFVSSFLVGLAGLAMERFSSSAAVSMPSTCRIISSTVDLRSSKVCDHGILNHKAASAEILKKPTFRCYYDYYWAAVLEVEYEEYLSGQTFHALAEVPKETLPHHCRPDFGTVWSTTMNFKVNETYRCGYLLSSQKVDLYSDDIFKCSAKDPSAPDASSGYLILLKQSFSQMVRLRPMVSVMAGAVCGMLVAMLVIPMIRCLNIFARAMAGKLEAFRLKSRDISRKIRGACFLVAYFSTIIWLILQYGKFIGLKQLLVDKSSIDERTTQKGAHI